MRTQGRRELELRKEKHRREENLRMLEEKLFIPIIAKVSLDEALGPQ
jgi:hypothetical protein